jgi:dihydroflavonol-4-reductase
VTSDDAPLVCVTGATGYVASCLVADLLGRGYRVRGTVRDLAKAPRLKALPGAAERLTVVEAELQAPATLRSAIDGCATVFHTASPYVLNVADPQRDLVDTAVHGTVNVLAACASVGGVRRVVLTSSMAAVTDEPESDHVLTEADWNTKSTLDRNPYYLSKTLAERAAWDFMAAEKPPFDLVVINPFVVMGPSLSPAVNVSNQILLDLVSGAFPAILSLTWGIVDVRDVALAHVRAAEVPAASGRYLCAAPPVTMRQVATWMREAGYGELTRLPTRGLDNWLGNLLVTLDSYRRPSGTGSYLRTHIGRTPRYDTTKAQRDLGLRFRPTRDTILDTLVDLARWGHLGGAPTSEAPLEPA